MRNNPVLFPLAPYTLLGVAPFWLPTPELKVATFALDTNGTSTKSGLGSDGWFHSPEGTTVGTELTFAVRPSDLPGAQRVGIAYTSKDYTRLSLEPKFASSGIEGFKERPDDWILWYNFEQYLHKDPLDPSQGFGLFGRLGYSSGEANPTERFFSLGFGGQGVIFGRDRDRYGIGYYYLDISDDLPSELGIDDEQGVEVFYNAVVTRWLTISADLQWVVQPAGGFEGRRNAVVWGLRLQIQP